MKLGTFSSPVYCVTILLEKRSSFKGYMAAIFFYVYSIYLTSCPDIRRSVERRVPARYFPGIFYTLNSDNDYLSKTIYPTCLAKFKKKTLVLHRFQLDRLIQSA